MATDEKSHTSIVAIPHLGLSVPQRICVQSRNTSYDNADSPLWRSLVYDAVHSGREFINIGGARALEAIASRLTPHNNLKLLEIGSGLGANCIYLGSRYGYDITGLDANPHQVSKAHARLTEAGDMQLRFIEADILTWLPDRHFDCVYTVDSLMLIPETIPALQKAYDCLKENGLLAITEMMAGPLLTNEWRQYAYKEDGIHLFSLEEYSVMLAAAEFVVVDVIDLSQLAGDTFQVIHRTVGERLKGGVDASTLKTYEDWQALSRAYRDGFRAQQYEYKLLFATR